MTSKSCDEDPKNDDLKKFDQPNLVGMCISENEYMTSQSHDVIISSIRRSKKAEITIFEQQVYQ